MALSMNSVGIPGGFRGNAGFRENLGFGVVSGDLGGQKAFAQIIFVSVKYFARNSGAGNGCANFMGAWKDVCFLQEIPCP